MSTYMNQTLVRNHQRDLLQAATQHRLVLRARRARRANSERAGVRASLLVGSKSWPISSVTRSKSDIMTSRGTCRPDVAY